MFTLDNYIEDSMDEFLESPGTTDRYVESGKTIDEKVASVRASLSDEKQLEFNRMLKLIDDQHSVSIRQAYTAGFMKGYESGLKM